MVLFLAVIALRDLIGVSIILILTVAHALGDK